MKLSYRTYKSKKKGAAMLTTFIVMSLVAVAGVTYVNNATQSIRISARQTQDVQTTHLCEAGVQAVLRSLWRPFKINQTFVAMEDACAGADDDNPRSVSDGPVPGVGRYSAGVIEFYSPGMDPYQRIVVVRSVGWLDRNNNAVLDENEPRKVVDVTAVYQLARSQVFDYTYFVNNYGWMDGFNVNDLIVNGDMRANGNFNFLNGSPTVNGSVFASINEKLTPPAAGLVNAPPVKWAQSTYNTAQGNTVANSNDNERRWRQAYDPLIHGARGSALYEQWRDVIFDSAASITNNRISGAVIGDSTGSKSWTRTSSGSAGSTSLLDPNPTDEVIMPDLSDLTYYENLSRNYRNPKQFYVDGTVNPNYNQPAYVDVWDQTLNAGAGGYKRISSNGIVSGSALLVGTATNPIRIHGPVTFTQDCMVKGFVEGQGTVYTGRNVHIVGSLRYKTPPNFRREGGRTTIGQIDAFNEKADMLGLAARGSVIMGKTTEFTNSYPLQYMTPPFTKGRYDENGNWIPPFDAKAVDASGRMRYQPAMGDTLMNSVAEGINQIDAILYTNFVGGGNIGVGGGGVIFNGTIISKDEAMVVYSLPMRMNYDTRIRERTISSNPLIDLQLPRSPVMLRSAWQDRGFFVSGGN